MRISDCSSDVCSSDLIEADDVDLARDPLDLAAHHRHPLLDREHRVLGRVGGDADDEPIDELRTAADDIHMAERDRIESAGINAGTRGHAASLSARKITGRARAHSGRCRSAEHTSELQSLMRISYAVL